MELFEYMRPHYDPDEVTNMLSLEMCGLKDTAQVFSMAIEAKKVLQTTGLAESEIKTILKKAVQEAMNALGMMKLSAEFSRIKLNLEVEDLEGRLVQLKKPPPGPNKGGEATHTAEDQ